MLGYLSALSAKYAVETRDHRSNDLASCWRCFTRVALFVHGSHLVINPSHSYLHGLNIGLLLTSFKNNSILIWISIYNRPKMTPANCFKCLSDETRLRCMMLLHSQSELCVCELTQALDLSQPKISRHLAQLRQCGLLLDTRRGQWVYYRINPDLSDWVLTILDVSAAALDNHERYQIDRVRLNTMSVRPAESVCCR